MKRRRGGSSHLAGMDHKSREPLKLRGLEVLGRHEERVPNARPRGPGVGQQLRWILVDLLAVFRVQVSVLWCRGDSRAPPPAHVHRSLPATCPLVLTGLHVHGWMLWCKCGL